jgi:hypothetical protein
MALIDRTVEGGLLRGVERADGLDQALDIVTARNRTAQDGPSQFGVIGKIIEEWVLFSVAARHVVSPEGVISGVAGERDPKLNTDLAEHSV